MSSGSYIAPGCVQASAWRRQDAYATLLGIVHPTWLNGGVEDSIGVWRVQLPGGSAFHRSAGRLPNFPPHREIEEGLAVLRHRA
jgi:hypothetical protein